MSLEVSPSWFLEESEQEKTYKAICNYLSLGEVEFATSLIRVHHEEKICKSSVDPCASRCTTLLLSLVEEGLPSSWIVSKSVPSSAHLLSLCVDFLSQDLKLPFLIPHIYHQRCEFDLTLCMGIIESGPQIGKNLSIDVINELRLRFAQFLLSINVPDGGSSIGCYNKSVLVLPRLLITSKECTWMLPEQIASREMVGSLESSSNEDDHDSVSVANSAGRGAANILNSPTLEWLFDFVRFAPTCGTRLLELLHSISYPISCQLTNVQVALVCEMVLSKEKWKGICRCVRFLNEFGQMESLDGRSNGFVCEMLSLLVTISNVENGLELVSVNFRGFVKKLQTECLSTSGGRLLPGGKKSSFSSSVPTTEDAKYISLSFLHETYSFVYSPNERMRMSLFECLCTKDDGKSPSVSTSLLKYIASLEDELLRIYSKKVLIPLSCADPTMCWDQYYEFLRVTKGHCLGYPLETAVGLIKMSSTTGEMSAPMYFQRADKLLAQFNQLKPVTILLGWELFGNSTEWDFRKNLLNTLWKSYLDQKKCDGESTIASLENLVWLLNWRYCAAGMVLQLASRFGNGMSLSGMDVFGALKSHSLVWALRGSLPNVGCSDLLFAWAKELPPVSLFDTSVESVRVSWDLDLTKCYCVLRTVVGLVCEISSTQLSNRKLANSIAEIDSICCSIERVEIRLCLLRTVLQIIFAQSDIFGPNASKKVLPNWLSSKKVASDAVADNPSVHIVDLGVFVSLLFFAWKQSLSIENSNLQSLTENWLLRFSIMLKQSLVYNEYSCKSAATGIIAPPFESCLESMQFWATVVNGDCGILQSVLDANFKIPIVNTASAIAPVCPPRRDKQLRCDKFVPRMIACSNVKLVKTALEMSDYVLAKSLLFDCEDMLSEKVESAQEFATFRDDQSNELLWRGGLQDSAKNIQPQLLVDLAISKLGASIDYSQNLLKRAVISLSKEVSSSSSSLALIGWINKAIVLLEARSQFANDTSAPAVPNGQMNLAELILGIETLPNEPELLKDHLNRMYTQRSIIMSLVDKIDHARRRNSNNEAAVSNDTTNLTEAINTLMGEQLKPSGGFSYLVKFLEYLSKTTSLVQGVSIFEVLSEDPSNLVARVVFEQNAMEEALGLCELMGLDLIDIIVRKSFGHEEVIGGGKNNYFISLEILQKIFSLDPYRVILISLERRAQKWPSMDILDFAINANKCGLGKGMSSGEYELELDSSAAAPHPITNWIVERKSAWIKFIQAYADLFGIDVSGGFTIDEERQLDPTVWDALRSVFSDEQKYMDALNQMAARAKISKGEYISALDELDEGLGCLVESTAETLKKEALLGCLKYMHDQLTPQQIYELLWRLDDVEELLSFTKQFYYGWESKMVLKALDLCAYRLDPSIEATTDESAIAFVENASKRVRVMDAVAQSIGGFKPEYNSWQKLNGLSDPTACERVLEDLLRVSEHTLADEFLSQKGTLFATSNASIDELSDKIELSRLRHLFRTTGCSAAVQDRSKDPLLKRLASVHHPLKASRLSLQLMESMDSIAERITLGQRLIANNIPCAEDWDAITTQLASLALFATVGNRHIRPEWNSVLLNRPDLVMKSILLNGQTKGIDIFLKEFPHWRKDRFVIELARKALGIEQSDERSPEKRDLGFYSNDIGLGGPYSLTGDSALDASILAHHKFTKQCDVGLCLEFLRLLSVKSKENANAIFDICSDLSLFMDRFVVGGRWEGSFGDSKNYTWIEKSVGENPVACPFTRLSFLRQCILSILMFLKESPLGAVSKKLSFSLTRSVDHLNLLSDIWSEVGIRIGLRNISQSHVQIELRDLLIELDLLDLAERVSPETRDVVTMRRVLLAIKMGRNFTNVVELLRNNIVHRPLTLDQLEQISEAIAGIAEFDLRHVKRAHSVLVQHVRLNRLGLPRMGFLSMDEKISSSEPSSAVQLLPTSIACNRIPIPASAQIAHIDESSSKEWTFVDTSVMELAGGCYGGDADAKNNTPRRLLLDVCVEFGEIGAVIPFLVRQGDIPGAVRQGLKLADPGVLVKHVSSCVGRGFVSISVWGEILLCLKEHRQTQQFLTAIEVKLRETFVIFDSRSNQAGYGLSCPDSPFYIDSLLSCLYAYEVALGRHAFAGLAAIQLYLRAESWDERIGFLESAERLFGLAIANRVSKRFKRNIRERRLNVRNEEFRDDGPDSDSSEDSSFELVAPSSSVVAKIPMPFEIGLHQTDFVIEASLPSARLLAGLQLLATKAMPFCPASASLFGSIQAVSELIDYLLMDNQVVLARAIIASARLPDSALCGIFAHDS